MTNKTNKTASYKTLSNNLINILDSLATTLYDSNTEDVSAGIFAAARQVRITARANGVLSRFDRQVKESRFSRVFANYDFNFTKWNNGAYMPSMR